MTCLYYQLMDLWRAGVCVARAYHRRARPVRLGRLLLHAVKISRSPAALGDALTAAVSAWGLTLGDPYPADECAWVAPARGPGGEELVLKVARRQFEAEHEADGLRFWDGDGAVRCLAERRLADATALLLERCAPGTPLRDVLPEPAQDVVIAGLLRRLWARPLPGDHPFRRLETMCDAWADAFEADLARDGRGLDPGLARASAEALRALPRSSERHVLLATDLHAGNVLAATREPWLAIDPKPFVGDPAYDAVQHLLNCEVRLASDPRGLARRMAGLLRLDPERVRLWLFARCAQEGLQDAAMREPARRLAP